MAEPFEADHQVEAFNRVRRQEAEEFADTLRQRFIDDAFEAVKLLWKKQNAHFDEIEEQGNPEDAVLEWYVIPSNTGFPFNEEGITPALCIELKPATPLVEPAVVAATGDPGVEDEDVVEDQSVMKVYVEVPDDTPFNSSMDVDALPQPSRVAVALTSPNGYSQNFVVTKFGITPFVNAVESGDQATEADTLLDSLADEETFEQELQEYGLRGGIAEDPVRIPEGMRADIEIIPRFTKYLIDWKAQIQHSLPAQKYDRNNPDEDQD